MKFKLLFSTYSALRKNYNAVISMDIIVMYDKDSSQIFYYSAHNSVN